MIWGFYFSTQFEGWENYDLLSKDQKCYIGKPHNRNVFWWVRYYGGRRLSDFWQKPVYTCTMCMSSFHSILPYFYHQGLSLDTLLEWPFYVMALAGLNYALMEKVYN